MNSKLVFTATTAIAIAIAILSISFAYDPLHIFGPPPLHGSQDRLKTAQLLPLVGAFGPESLAFDPNGEGPYTGVADGRVLKWQGQDLGWIEFAVTSPNRNDCVRPFAPELEHVCGRPLGLRFHKKTGDLYIADAYFGLEMVGSGGGLATQLVTEAEGEPFRFTNDMDIDEEQDTIYFTDTSTIFPRREFIPTVYTGDNTGRLMKYNIANKEVEVLLRGLSFANGVAMSKDGSFVLVAETTTCRILRFWLWGPKAGSLDVFAELPGFPDNIRRNSKGEFWVALHSKKGLVANLIVSNVWLGKALLKLPLSFKQLHSMLVGWRAHASAMKLSEEGKVLEVLEDCEGRTLRFISEVEEKNGSLWIGSVMVPFVGLYNV